MLPHYSPYSLRHSAALTGFLTVLASGLSAVFTASTVYAHSLLAASGLIFSTTYSGQSDSLSRPLREHGRFLWSSAATQSGALRIQKQDYQRLDYTGLSEILAERLASSLPLVPRFLGGQGLFNHLSLLGSTPRDVAVMFNGRSMIEPAFGAFTLDQFPPEMMESVEVFVGSDAALLADNAAGALLNIQEPLHNTKTLYTRIWAMWSGTNFGASDATVSYNLAPTLNATLGYRNQQSSDWHPNSSLRAWNVRSTLRWNPSQQLNASLTYLFTQHRTGMSGGVDSLIRGVGLGGTTARPLLSEFEQNTIRHDVTLSGTLLLGSGASRSSRATGNAASPLEPEHASQVANGLSGVLSLVGYASAATWEQQRRAPERGTLPFPPDFLISSTFGSLSVGATARLETTVHIDAVRASLLVGGTLGVESSEQSGYFGGAALGVLNGFGRLEFALADDITLSGGIRASALAGRFQLALGARLTAQLARFENGSTSAWADISRSFRTPSLAETPPYAASGNDSNRVFPPAGFADHPNALLSEAHLLGIAGIMHRGTSSSHHWSMTATGFYRLVSNPILTRLVGARSSNPLDTSFYAFSTESVNGLSKTVLGLSLGADVSFKGVLFAQGNVVLSGFAHVLQSATALGAVNGLPETNETPDKAYPALYAGLNAQYEYTIARSVLRLGVRVRAMTPFRGERFFPTTWSYLSNTLSNAVVQHTASYVSPQIAALASNEQALTGNGIDIIAGADVGNAYIRATYQNALNWQYFYVPIYPMYGSNLRLSFSFTILD